MNRLLPAVLLTLAISGCGGGGPTLFQLKGEVKFDGQPVPFGRVEFEPDTAQKNSGGLGYAEIVDGKYDTAAPGGRGVVGGKHLVRFTGQATKPSASADASGTIDEVAAAAAPPVEYLFNGYTQPYDLPQADSTLDFNLPPEAKDSLTGPAARRGRSNEP